MQDVRKVHPPNKEVLKGLWLSFLPGAKIGVLGTTAPARARCCASWRASTRTSSARRAADGLRIGYLPQEPQLDPGKPTVRGNVSTASPSSARSAPDASRSASKRSAMLLGDDPDEMDKLLEEQASLQDKIEACNGWDLDRAVERRWTRCACPRPTPTSTSSRAASGAAWRSAGCCSRSPTCLLLDEPTNHLDAESVAWLERFLHDFPGTVVAVTHDRYFLDNVAGWILELDRGQGYPFEGNYSAWLEHKQKRLADEQKPPRARSEDAGARARVGAHVARARQAKSKARLSAYDELLAASKRARSVRPDEIIIPAGRASATS
jgi:sulfate-transporting ATPase